MTMKILESTENYLEAILVIEQTEKICRAIDIAHYLGFSKPSVSNALKKMKLEGLVEVNPKGFITLTDAGLEIALKTKERHDLLYQIFIKLGISSEVAASDACRVEHQISDETFLKLKEYFNLKMNITQDN